MSKKPSISSKSSKPSKTARAQRAPNLDDERILKIVELLDGWVGALTWDLFIEDVEAKVGGRYVRQTLDRHVRIKEAFGQAKERLAGKRPASRKLTPKEVEKRMADYDRLKNEVERLQRENNSYAKQFARWVWNLRQMKISEDQLGRLDNALPESLRS